jgi:hypothetical protein
MCCQKRLQVTLFLAVNLPALRPLTQVLMSTHWHHHSQWASLRSDQGPPVRIPTLRDASLHILPTTLRFHKSAENGSFSGPQLKMGFSLTGCPATTTTALSASNDRPLDTNNTFHLWLVYRIAYRPFYSGYNLNGYLSITSSHGPPSSEARLPVIRRQ